MLRELRNVRQIADESPRRCFSDPDMDLTVWQDAQGGVVGFELCYDKGRAERAVRWDRKQGFLHQRVDDGENRPGRHKSTPILVPDGLFDAKKISRLFHDSSREIDRSVAEFIYRTLLDYPA